jgi:ATP-dependent Lon protease
MLSREEWRDLLLRSIGLEPTALTERARMLYLLRLIPFVERNYNLVELGPRNTGKSYVYRELSPYSILVSGGEATVASLFIHLGTGRIGMVGMWDVVAFDEVAGLRRLKDATAIQILKDYMEAGSFFSRGRDEIQANASMVFVGNLNLDVETAVRTSHLFTAFPKEMQDLALLDRIHAYVPGWELPKMHSQFIGRNYGFVVDYLAEVFRVRPIQLAGVGLDEVDSSSSRPGPPPRQPDRPAMSRPRRVPGRSGSNRATHSAHQGSGARVAVCPRR